MPAVWRIKIPFMKYLTSLLEAVALRRIEVAKM